MTDTSKLYIDENDGMIRRRCMASPPDTLNAPGEEWPCMGELKFTVEYKGRQAHKCTHCGRNEYFSSVYPRDKL